MSSSNNKFSHFKYNDGQNTSTKYFQSRRRFTHWHLIACLFKKSYSSYRFVISILLLLTSIGLLYINHSYYRINIANYYTIFYANNQIGIISQHCHLPQLDPYDSSILQYWSKPTKLSCRRYQPELTYVTEENILMINVTEMEIYKTVLVCHYRCFDRMEDLNDVTLKYGEWNPLNSTSPVNLTSAKCSFIDVSCARLFPTFISVYSNTHATIIPKPQLNLIINESIPSSVFLFILDSVSHSNFIRNLPKTLDVLKRLYKITIFDGYAKVGDNSLPNAAAFLTGKRVNVAGYQSDLDDDMSHKFYDDWPFIWKKYAEHGYKTLYAEDFPNFNLFQYMSNGFKNRPVDYYYRPFWVHLWKTFLHMRSTHLCYGNSPKHRLQLDYVRRFLRSYTGRPTFAFNWLTELGHDWMNQINVGDDDIADYFTEVKQYLNNTMVIVLSDHGHRFDAIRQTVIGRLEERMPFFGISLPSTWENRLDILQTLRRNSKILTTPYDLHATLSHFLSLNVVRRNKKRNANKKFNESRGLSLFDALPENRPCKQANVPEEYCVCQEEMNVVNASNDERCKSAATKAVHHINALLSDNADKCAMLSLASVQQAQTFLPNLNTIFDNQVSILYNGHNPSGFYINYRVMFSTTPGGGLFESTLRYSLKDEQFLVIGDVSRINKYGDQSLCVQSALLRKFCFCGFLSSKNETDASA